MKPQNCLLSLLLSVVFFGTSCDKNNTTAAPAPIISANYLGTFNGVYNFSTVQVTNTYPVTVTQLSNTRVRVSGNHFNSFEVDLVNNGSTVAVQNVNSSITQFVYTNSSNQLTFNYVDGANTAQFTGTKQ